MIRVRLKGWASRVTFDDQTFGGVGATFSVGRVNGRIQRFERRSGADLCSIVDMNLGEYASHALG